MTAGGEPSSMTADGTLTQLVRARSNGKRALDGAWARIQRDSRLGTGYLGIGTVILGFVLIGRGLISFAWTWADNDWRLLTGTGWVLVVAAFAVAMLVALRNRGTLPLAAFLALLAADATAIALDDAATSLNGNPESYLTVGIGVGGSLLACVTLRPMSNLVVATSVLAAGSVAFLLWHATMVAGSGMLNINPLVLTVLPVIAGLIVVRSFEQVVRHELDRTVVESTIDAPRFGHGILASSELARLDLAAEELLADVASGRAPLPLDRDVAELATSIGADLRMALGASQNESWLHYALTESAYLAPTVTLTDHAALAGQLEAAQRNGLLSAVWLIVESTATPHAAVDLVISAVAGVTRAMARVDRVAIEISITVSPAPERGIDPAVWPALARVGQFTVDARSARVRISLIATVPTPDALA